MLQQIGLISIIVPLLMGFFSFISQKLYVFGERKGFSHIIEITINVVYLLMFFILFIFIAKSAFSLHLIKGAEYKYVIGGWTKAMGIEMKYNISTALALMSVCLIASIFFATNLFNCINYAFRGFVCIMICGANGIIMTNDIFNSYVFFEVVCITTYIIYAHGKGKECVKNTFNYMMISSFAGVAFLLVAGMLYQITGNLNLDLMRDIIVKHPNNKSINALFVIFLLSMLFKLGIYPLHSILNNIYNNLETNKLMVVAGVSSIAYPVFIVKMILHLFGTDVLLANEYLHIVLKIFGGVGFLFFNVMAFSMASVKNFIIALSFAQTSLFAFCIPYLSDSTIQVGLLFAITSHAVLKVCLFAVLDKMQTAFKSENIVKTNFCHIKEQSYKAIYTTLLFLIAGMPLSLVFMSKWYILKGFIYVPNSIIWLIILLIGFSIDIVACFKFIMQILTIKKDDYTISVSIKKNILLIFTIIFAILFIILSSAYSNVFNLKKVKPIMVLSNE